MWLQWFWRVIISCSLFFYLFARLEREFFSFLEKVDIRDVVVFSVSLPAFVEKKQFRWFRNFLKSEIIRPRCCRKISRILVRGRDSSSLRTWSSSRTSTHSRRTTMTPPSLLFGREARCYSGKHVLLIFVPNVFFLRTCDNLFVKFVL